MTGHCPLCGCDWSLGNCALDSESNTNIIRSAEGTATATVMAKLVGMNFYFSQARTLRAAGLPSLVVAELLRSLVPPDILKNPIVLFWPSFLGFTRDSGDTFEPRWLCRLYQSGGARPWADCRVASAARECHDAFFYNRRNAKPESRFHDEFTNASDLHPRARLRILSVAAESERRVAESERPASTRTVNNKRARRRK